MLSMFRKSSIANYYNVADQLIFTEADNTYFHSTDQRSVAKTITEILPNAFQRPKNFVETDDNNFHFTDQNFASDQSMFVGTDKNCFHLIDRRNVAGTDSIYFQLTTNSGVKRGVHL